MRKKAHITKFEKEAGKIKLRAFERRELKDQLVSYMEYHPLAEPVVAKREATQRAKQKQTQSKAAQDFIPSESFVFVALNTMRMRIAAGAFALVLIVGVPFAAERSVPGDVLYPVKVRINEEVREGLTFDGYKKVAWETERVERRIAEARLLAKEGKLTEETEAAIGEEVRQHAKAAQAELAELKESNADDAAVAEAVLQSALGVQSLVLDDQVADEKKIASTTRASVEGLASAVREVLSDINEESGKSTSTPSYASFVARVESETTRARELFDAINGAATDEEHAEILRRIEDNERAFEKAVELKEEEGDAAAIIALKAVLLNTQKLITFMTDIDVRESVELETLIPKELTDEERTDVVETIGEEARKTAAIVERRLAVSEDEDLNEKVELGLLELERLLETLEEVLESESDEALSAAEGVATDLAAVTLDLEKMTYDIPLPDSPDDAVGDEAGDQNATTTDAAVPGEGEFGIIDPEAPTATTTDEEETAAEADTDTEAEPEGEVRGTTTESGEVF